MRTFRCSERLIFASLGSFSDSLNSRSIPRKIEFVLVQKIFQNILHQPVVKIDTAQKGIATRRDDFEHAAFDIDDGDIESATTQIVYGDSLIEIRPKP